MAKVIENKIAAENIYLLTVQWGSQIKMGQFFMLRCWDLDPLLSRPISVYDYEDGKIYFLYQVVGKGTDKISKLKAGDNITLEGPFGNGFPYIDKQDITLVGGGMGIAPLYYATKELKRIDPNRKLDIYLGSNVEHPIIQSFKESFEDVFVNIGGIITDYVEYKDEIIFTCGPEIMMKKICEEACKKSVQVYASIEKRMACGLGACLGCTCKTTKGNKRTCKDGPVFLGEEIIYE